jgi:hypothetical protein
MTGYDSPRIRLSTLPLDLHFTYYYVNYTRTNISEKHSLYPPDEYRRLMELGNYTMKSSALLAEFLSPELDIAVVFPWHG